MPWANKAATDANWMRRDPPDVAVTDSTPAEQFWHAGWEGDFVSEVQIMGKKSDGTFELLKTDDVGHLGVTLSGSEVIDHTFQDAVAAPAVGGVLTVGRYKTLMVEVWGTSTSRTVKFEALGPEGATYRPLMGVRLSDLAAATQTTTSGEMWQFDVSGLTSVRMNLTAVAGGVIAVAGRAVA